VIDSVEKLFEVEINHPAVACGDVLLRLSYRLMCRSIHVASERDGDDKWVIRRVTKQRRTLGS
jgi:hypothetical protein